MMKELEEERAKVQTKEQADKFINEMRRVLSVLRIEAQSAEAQEETVVPRLDMQPRREEEGQEEEDIEMIEQSQSTKEKVEETEQEKRER